MSAMPQEIEGRFVGLFWRAALQNDQRAWKVQAQISPGMFFRPNAGKIYAEIARRFSAGIPFEYVNFRDDPLDEFFNALREDSALEQIFEWVYLWSHRRGDLLEDAEHVIRFWQAREQVDLLRLGLEEASKSLEQPDRAKRVAERLSLKLLDTFANDPGESRPQTRDELIDDQLARMDDAGESGIVLPWPRMQEACGPWMPGEVIGLTGFSGSGKSTVTANLAMQVARRGTPVIVFPTEMLEQWLTRAICGLCRFPQLLAEKRLFRQATAEMRSTYRRVADEVRTWPWQMVNRPNVTPAEVIGAVRTLRRQWPGQTVLVIVDHMHRLDYGMEEADKLAGAATKSLKNFAKADRDGLVFLCLYQPRKPENDHALYQPIYANRIRGHSSVWNEVDVHMSVYRTWGERSMYGNTEWGDPAVERRGDGSPKIAKPDGPNSVLNTEFTFLKPDKRRIGGEGPSFHLNIDKPSGQIFEQSQRVLQAV